MVNELPEKPSCINRNAVFGNVRLIIPFHICIVDLRFGNLSIFMPFWVWVFGFLFPWPNEKSGAKDRRLLCGDLWWASSRSWIREKGLRPEAPLSSTRFSCTNYKLQQCLHVFGHICGRSSKSVISGDYGRKMMCFYCQVFLIAHISFQITPTDKLVVPSTNNRPEALQWTYEYGDPDDLPNDPELLYTNFGRAAKHRETCSGCTIGA